MRDIIIKVDQDKADDSIMIGISGALFTMDNLLDKNTIHFWLTKEKANELARFIDYSLQEIELSKEEAIDSLELQQCKYGEERREMGKE